MATSHVLVCLPDGSIRLFDEPLLIARDVLRDFPHHDLFLSPTPLGDDRGRVYDCESVCDDDDARSTVSSAAGDGGTITKSTSASEARRFDPVNPHRCLKSGSMYYLMPRREFAWKCQLQDAEAAETAAARMTTKKAHQTGLDQDNISKLEDNKNDHGKSNGCRHLAARETSPVSPAPSHTSSSNVLSPLSGGASPPPPVVKATPVNTESPDGHTHATTITTTIISSAATTTTTSGSSSTSSSGSNDIPECVTSDGGDGLHEAHHHHPAAAFPHQMPHFLESFSDAFARQDAVGMSFAAPQDAAPLYPSPCQVYSGGLTFPGDSSDGVARAPDAAAAAAAAAMTGFEYDESQLMLMLLLQQQSMLHQQQQQLLEARRWAEEAAAAAHAAAPWAQPQTFPEFQIGVAARAEDGGEKQESLKHECYYQQQPQPPPPPQQQQQQQEREEEAGESAKVEARPAAGLPALDTSELARQLSSLHANLQELLGNTLRDPSSESKQLQVKIQQHEQLQHHSMYYLQHLLSGQNALGVSPRPATCTDKHHHAQEQQKKNHLFAHSSSSSAIGKKLLRLMTLPGVRPSNRSTLSGQSRAEMRDSPQRRFGGGGALAAVEAAAAAAAAAAKAGGRASLNGHGRGGHAHAHGSGMRGHGHAHSQPRLLEMTPSTTPPPSDDGITYMI
ncbi:unnamed protein product [Closterium sp. NIES-64]|nr:unnamed protein product [Closterium sp. NIES-64]